MPLFNKTDMLYDDYDWKAKYENDDPKVTGVPDSTLLARKEGYEMLYFVNKYAEINSWKQTNSCQKVERLIRTVIPTNIRSQANIRTWLDENYNKSA